MSDDGRRNCPAPAAADRRSRSARRASRATRGPAAVRGADHRLIVGGMALLLVLNTVVRGERAAPPRPRAQGRERRRAGAGTAQRRSPASAAPAQLAAAAAALGMVPASNPAFLIVGANGSVRVMGSPSPASGVPHRRGAAQEEEADQDAVQRRPPARQDQRGEVELSAVAPDDPATGSPTGSTSSRRRRTPAPRRRRRPRRQPSRCREATDDRSPSATCRAATARPAGSAGQAARPRRAGRRAPVRRSGRVSPPDARGGQPAPAPAARCCAPRRACAVPGHPAAGRAEPPRARPTPGGRPAATAPRRGHPASRRRRRRMRLGRSRRRLRWGLVAVCILLLVIGGRLVQLQGVDNGGYAGRRGRPARRPDHAARAARVDRRPRRHAARVHVQRAGHHRRPEAGHGERPRRCTRRSSRRCCR